MSGFALMGLQLAAATFGYGCRRNAQLPASAGPTKVKPAPDDDP